MGGRFQLNSAWAWRVQRASALVLVACVVVHLATMVWAHQQGLSAAAILARTQGSVLWAGFYSVFVLAVALHAPLGLWRILREWTALPALCCRALCVALALWCLVVGLAAVRGLVA